MQIGETLGGKSFSKQHETEADYIAAYILARAGYNPEAAGQLWIKLAKASGKMESKLFDTHPAGPERLAAWEKAVDEVRMSPDLMPNPKGKPDESIRQVARRFEPATQVATGRRYAATPAVRTAPAPRYGNALAGIGKMPVMAAVASRRGLRGVWHADGVSTSCSVGWIMRIEIGETEIRGKLAWGLATYHIYGKFDRSQNSQRARAGKDRLSRNIAAPRFLGIHLEKLGDRISGFLGVDGNEAACRANFVLRTI